MNDLFNCITDELYDPLVMLCSVYNVSRFKNGFYISGYGFITYKIDGDDQFLDCYNENTGEDVNIKIKPGFVDEVINFFG